MIVLGCYWVSDITLHSTSACIVKDGKLLAMINEDRITRIKLDSSPPRNSIKEVLRISKIDPKDVDAVAIPVEGPFKAWIYHSTVEGDGIKKLRNFIGLPVFYFLRKYRLRKYLNTLGIDAPIYFVRHHIAHAAMAYYTSGMKNALIMSIDGGGDAQSTTIKIGKGKEIIDVTNVTPGGSIGGFYTKVTSELGFKSGEEEGKVTGLAAYGKPLGIFDDVFKVKGLKVEGDYKAKRFESMKISDGEFNLPRAVKYQGRVTGLLNKYKKEDIAASAQATLEKVVVQLTKNTIRKLGMKDICLGGGVVLNVKMNKKIAELANQIAIPFEPSDVGTPVGAALYVNMLLGSFFPEKLEHSYFGTSYTQDEIDEVLEQWRLKYDEVNPSKAGAELVQQGKVIGFFQGAMEAGPRSLGNRSCLALASDKNMRDRINTYLKNRDWFMPFAPSCLDEKKDEYFYKARESPFMMLSFDVKNPEKIPAVIHVDNTSRPQTVKKETNPTYHKLIKNCGGIILNTSFNKHGEPIVRTPQDALMHLMRGNVEALIIGNKLVFHPNLKRKK